MARGTKSDEGVGLRLASGRGGKTGGRGGTVQIRPTSASLANPATIVSNGCAEV